MPTIKHIWLSMRPHQWVKNLLIFAGLIFSRNLFNALVFWKVVGGFSCFCLAASSIYLFNDIKDLEQDRGHPEKCQRPLPACDLKIAHAYIAAVAIAVISVFGSYLLNTAFLGLVALYLIINIAYTIKIKHIVILDVMCIAFGFVLRVFAGTTLAKVEITDWLIICTITLSMFLGFSKRRHEITLMQSGLSHHRGVLSEYSVKFLDQMIAVTTACAVMSYALYTISDETVARFQTRNLVITIPFVFYGIFRYLYLIHQKEIGGNPTHALLTDRPLIINNLLWFAAVLLIIY